MPTIDSLDRFLEGQFQAWSRQDVEHQNNRTGPVIAISREPGCGGKRIAQTIADALGLTLFDSNIIEQIATNAHVSEQVVATLDENVRTELDDWLSSLASGPGFSSEQYMQCLRSVLFTIATHGNAVILGRGANFLLPPEKKTLGLCLVAPLDVRVKNIAHELQLTPEDARKYIARKERERRVLVKQMSHADIADAANYHLVINTAMVAPETIVQIVKEIVRASR